MEAAAAKEWFLRKQEDGTIFGPLSFELLSRWASAAQVAPNDVVSNDQQAWIKAPMVPELGMDWLVELTSERYYGPTTLGAIQEFIRLGEINAETFIINSCDGVRKKICDFPMLLQTSQEPGSVSSETTAILAPAAAESRSTSTSEFENWNKLYAKNAVPCRKRKRAIVSSRRNIWS